MLKVFNDLKNELEEFIPLNAPNVLMYVCGPTVYDVPHLGHARSEVSFDLIRRYLEFKGYYVKYVHNYTDVDDKMINRANLENIDILELANRNIIAYENMQSALYVKTPTVKPRATEVIVDIINTIQVLEQKGYTYQSEGSIYFDTSKMLNYKTLFMKSSKSEEVLDEEFSQSEFLDDKRNTEDFVLWKKEKPGEPSWESPWGKGRPGWHIECSAMSMKYLGDSIDIHGGGKDLKRPHHQNEIAQSECATGKTFCKYWLHNGFLNINSSKMSKSLGNFIPLQDLLDKYPGDAIRYYFLSSYYQRPIDFTLDKIDQAVQSLKKLNTFIEKLKKYDAVDPEQFNDVSAHEIFTLERETVSDLISKFYEAMDNDFNSAKSLGFLFSLVNFMQKKVINLNKPLDHKVKDKILEFFVDINNFLDIFHQNDELDSSLSSNSVKNDINSWKNKLDSLIQAILTFRGDLKEQKNYELADALRSLLDENGITVIDNGKNFQWEYKDENN